MAAINETGSNIQKKGCTNKMYNFLASVINIFFLEGRLIFVYGLNTFGGKLPSVQSRTEGVSHSIPTDS